MCGGGSGAAGLGPRLLHEIKSIAPPSAQPGLCAVPEYMPEHTLRAAAWMGGAVLSKVSKSSRISRCAILNWEALGHWIGTAKASKQGGSPALKATHLILVMF